MSNRQLARVIADSLSPDGVRITTVEATMPRIVLAEFNTHRDRERNSASSRAIPTAVTIRRVTEDPFVPEDWGRNGKGMQAHGSLDEHTSGLAAATWLDARDKMVAATRELHELGVHKQLANRLLEPFQWHTVIMTATEWSNFFNLRCSPLAQPEIERTASAIREAMQSSEPRILAHGEWHLPFVDERDAELTLTDKLRVSTARLARVSYLTHNGIRDVQHDFDLHDSLLSAGHMSPFGHPARPMTRADVEERMHFLGATGVDWGRARISDHFSGPFRGWWQYRKTIAGEHDIVGWKRGDYL